MFFSMFVNILAYAWTFWRDFSAQDSLGKLKKKPSEMLDITVQALGSLNFFFVFSSLGA